MRKAVLRTAGRLGAVLAAAAGASACADIRRATSLPPVNPESPVAAAVAVGARQNFATPAFTNVPPAPKNVPTSAQVKTAAFAMVGTRRAMERWDSTHPPMVADTVAFAKLEESKTDTNPADVPTSAEDAASVAYGQKLRDYAAPPPALPSGPPPAAAQASPPQSAPQPAPAAKPAPPAKRSAVDTASARPARKRLIKATSPRSERAKVAAKPQPTPL